MIDNLSTPGSVISATSIFLSSTVRSRPNVKVVLQGGLPTERRGSMIMTVVPSGSSMHTWTRAGAW